MSLINDALKQARQAPPRNLPNSVPALHPTGEEETSASVWLIPAIIIILIVAAIFFIGWSAAHNAVNNITTAPEPVVSTQMVDGVVLPVVHATDSPAPVLPPPPVPRLQGIFYSTTAPTAILDGKTVRPGDQFKEFKVKEISKYTVILIGPDSKEIQVGMGN
jgi:hypothetical protein